MFFTLVVVFLLGFSSCSVLQLTKSNFKETITGSKHCFVEFFSPTCPHCVALEPHWRSLGEHFDDSLSVTIASCDCSTNKELCEASNVHGWPTLLWFTGDSKPVKYQGQRTSAALINFVNAQILPAVQILNEASSLLDFKQSDDAVVVGFFDEQFKHSDAYLAFQQAAEILRGDIRCGLVFSRGRSHVVLFKTYDDRELAYTGEPQAQQMATWIKQNKIPLLVEHNIPQYGLDYPLCYLHLNSADDATERTPQFSAFLRASRYFRSRGAPISLAWLDKRKWDGVRSGLSGNRYPAITIDDFTRTKGYTYRFAFPEDQEITEDSVKQWIQAYLDGKLTATKYSLPVPAKNDGHVKILVLNNFDEIVANREDEVQFVFVLFHHETCGTCQKFYPVFDELAASFEEMPNVAFAKADAWNNDWPPEWGLSGVPDLRLFIKGQKSPVEFPGNDRAMETIERWLKRNIATYSVTGDGEGENKEEL